MDLLLDTGSSRTWVDSYNDDSPRTTYMYNEQKDRNLDCPEGKTYKIDYMMGDAVEGPLCETTVQVHGTDEMKCRLPIVLRQDKSSGGWS